MRFGVEVDGLDAVPEALHGHRLVVVRGLALDLPDQVGLTARLGRVVGREPGRPQVRYEDERGRHPDQTYFNEQWHADLSWCAEGPVITVLYALRIGWRAAATAFVDTVSGWASLPPDLRARAAGWRARHHVERSRHRRHGRGSPRPGRPGRGLPDAGPRADAVKPTLVAEPGALRDVVGVDPGSGRPGVMLGDHAWTLAGMDESEGADRVDDLQARVVAGGDRYVHPWRRGDLVVFDNRTVLHRREPTRFAGRRRILRRTVAWPPPA